MGQPIGIQYGYKWKQGYNYVDRTQKRMDLIREALILIWKKAKEDDIITPDEKAIIDSVTTSIETLESTFKKAAEDGIITQEEMIELFDLEEKMYSDAYFTAMRDNILTEEEALLLKALILTINPKSDISWLESDISST